MIRWLATLIGLLLLTGPLLATTSETITLPCPACGNKVEVQSIASSTTFGSERDLRVRSTAQYAEFVATCDKCLYSGFEQDFRLKLDPLVATKIRDGAIKLPKGEQRPIKPWVACELTVQALKLKGAPPGLQAQAIMEVAWALRDATPPIAGIEDNGMSSQQIDKLMTSSKVDQEDSAKAVKDLEKAIGDNKDPKSRQLLGSILVLILCKMGEYDQALNKLPKLEGLPANTETKVRAMAARERGYLSQVREQLQLEIDSRKGEEPAFLTYLMAELNRRLGDKARAREWYEKALKKPDLGEPIKSWIPEQMALLNEPDPTRPAKNSSSREESPPWIPAAAAAIIVAGLGWRRARRRKA